MRMRGPPPPASVRTRPGWPWASRHPQSLMPHVSRLPMNVTHTLRAHGVGHVSASAGASAASLSCCTARAAFLRCPMPCRVVGLAPPSPWAAPPTPPWATPPSPGACPPTPWAARGTAGEGLEVLRERRSEICSGSGACGSQSGDIRRHMGTNFRKEAELGGPRTAQRGFLAKHHAGGTWFRARLPLGARTEQSRKEQRELVERQERHNSDATDENHMHNMKRWTWAEIRGRARFPHRCSMCCRGSSECGGMLIHCLNCPTSMCYDCFPPHFRRVHPPERSAVARAGVRHFRKRSGNSAHGVAARCVFGNTNEFAFDGNSFSQSSRLWGCAGIQRFRNIGRRGAWES